MAANCPHCGCPIAARPVSDTRRRSRILKAAMIVGALMMIVGLFMAMRQETQAGSLMILGGLAIYAPARIKAWWSHE